MVCWLSARFAQLHETWSDHLRQSAERFAGRVDGRLIGRPSLTSALGIAHRHLRVVGEMFVRDGDVEKAGDRLLRFDDTFRGQIASTKIEILRRQCQSKFSLSRAGRFHSVRACLNPILFAVFAPVQTSFA